MPDPGREYFPGEASSLSEGARSGVGQQSAGETKLMAGRTAVTARTVRRWGTSAAQRLNIVPLQVEGRIFEELPDPINYRATVAEALTVGISRPPMLDGEIARYEEPFAALSDAGSYVHSLRTDVGDPYLSEAWVRMDITGGTPDLWVVVVIYVRLLPGQYRKERKRK